MGTYLFGLENSKHDFTEKKSFGKNIFTNAWPVALGQYLSHKRHLPIPLIEAVVDGERTATRIDYVSWERVLGCGDSSHVYFSFENIYEGYDRLVREGKSPNKSDLVVMTEDASRHLRSFEIKLVVAPTSQTANYEKRNQSCELVVRPSTIEQLAYSIAHSYGEGGKSELQRTITDALNRPSSFRWADETFMGRRLEQVLNAARNIVHQGIEVQTPLVLNALWRTESQAPLLDENAFDHFVWTDMAFLQLLIDEVSYQVETGKTEITRPGRSLIWLIRSLMDYVIDGCFDFARVLSEIIFNVQSDKAAAFSGERILRHLGSDEFYEPRVKRSEISEILTDEGISYLQPERRLDYVLYLNAMREQLVNDSK